MAMATPQHQKEMHATTVIARSSSMQVSTPSYHVESAHVRRRSVTLTPRWEKMANESFRVLVASGNNYNTNSENNDDAVVETAPKLPGTVAFFPLPSLQDSPILAERLLVANLASAPPLPELGSTPKQQRHGHPREVESSASPSPPDFLQERLVPADEQHQQEASDDSSLHSFSSIGSVTESLFSDYHHAGADEIWQDVPMGPPDAILGIAQAYRASTDARKVNVCVGAYRDTEGLPWVLPSVRIAEERLLFAENEVKEYLPIEGDGQYIEAAMKFAYGTSDPSFLINHVAAVQTLSGTGACRIGGEFLAQFWANHPIYVPDPTWGNHIAIFKKCGLDVRRYRYYNRSSNGLDLRGMLRDLSRAPDGSIVLLHAVAHNPTGTDPSIDEWKHIISLLSEKDMVAFFDSAYQGFASGDAEADAQPFRYAVSQHVPILLAQSFAKNFGLYGERVGTLSVVCGDVDQKARILSVLKNIIRPMYSSPPRHGSSIVKTILRDVELTKQYRQECFSMAQRIGSMRTKLVDALAKAGSQHDWSHLNRQIGMFAFTGMTSKMCEQLTKEYAIFLTVNGRISVAGLNDSNVNYVAKAIHAVTHGETITA